MADDKGHMIRECGVGKQQIEIARFNFAGAAPGGFVKRAHVINSSIVVSPSSGRALARDIPGLPRDNMFTRKPSQGKIGLVRSVQAPARDFVPTFDETANVIVERTLTAATRQIVPDCDFHLSTPIGLCFFPAIRLRLRICSSIQPRVSDSKHCPPPILSALLETEPSSKLEFVDLSPHYADPVESTSALLHHRRDAARRTLTFGRP